MQKFITHQGKRLSYHVSGNGTPLTLIHGFGEDSTIWESVLKYLEPHLQLIIPDLPGAGGSDVLPGEPSMEAMADAVAAIFKEENISSCNVVGHSMGGYVTLALVEKYPELVKAFGLFHSSPFEDDDAKKAKRDKDIDFIKRNGSVEFIKLLIPALFAEAFVKEDTDIVNELVERYKKFSPEGLVYALTAMKNRPDRSHIVSTSTNPFLLIAGVEDKVITLEMINRIYKMPQYTFGLFIRKAAHMGMIESSEVCAKHLLNWVNALDNV